MDEGFSGNCTRLPTPTAQFLLVRYPAGHVGFPSVDPADLLSGDVCGTATIWQRILSMIGFLNESFPDGIFGPGSDFDPLNLDPRGDLVSAELASPALRPANGTTTPVRQVRVYRPPAFFHSEASFPVVYFLGGYGQEPKDFDRMRELLDTLVLAGQLQNMYFAFLPGAGGRKGSFYVNHVVPETQVPEITEITSGRHEDSILQDLIPAIENEILGGRVRS
jgi:hypothetical protein